MTQEQFKQRYINYLLSIGLDRVKAVMLYDKGIRGVPDAGYGPEWYAREELACDR